MYKTLVVLPCESELNENDSDLPIKNAGDNHIVTLEVHHRKARVFAICVVLSRCG